MTTSTTFPNLIHGGELVSIDSDEASASKPKTTIHHGMPPMVGNTGVVAWQLPFPLLMPLTANEDLTTTTTNMTENPPTTPSKTKRVSLEPDCPSLLMATSIDDACMMDTNNNKDFDADTLMRMQLIEDEEDLDLFFWVEDEAMDTPDVVEVDQDLQRLATADSFEQDDAASLETIEPEDVEEDEDDDPAITNAPTASPTAVTEQQDCGLFDGAAICVAEV